MEGEARYNNIQVCYYVPENAGLICYFHGTGEQAKEFYRVYGQRQVGFLAIAGEDWNRDLSPWAAPAVFRQSGDDFGGKAAEYLSHLAQTVIPETEHAIGLDVHRRGLLGYSLAGLFAIYAMYETDLFTDVASVSGSLWYDGFVEYVKEKEPRQRPKKVYLSLGSKEKNTRNPRMAGIEICTLEVQRHLQQLGIPCIFEQNPGNHFYQQTERMKRAIEWLLHDTD